MTVQKTLTYTVVALGLALTLGACGSSGEQSSAPADTEAVAEAPAAEAQTAPESSAEMQSSQGGQVVESGPYHLELITSNESDGVHLDFFLQKGDTHEAIADAKVMAQVQSPDGAQKSLEMAYDADGGHYTALLPATASGDYSVAILSDVGGEKVNGRFTFVK